MKIYTEYVTTTAPHEADEKDPKMSNELGIGSDAFLAKLNKIKNKMKRKLK